MSSPELLHELFEQQADQRADFPAVVCGNAQSTYGELERRANQLARRLRSHGIGRGDCVGLLLPRSLEVYVALLGILKSGAVYVPLDPEYPAERVEFILSDCQARGLITNSDLAAKAHGFPGERIVLGEPTANLEPFSSKRLSQNETGTTSEDLCYVIYTSGTTGNPKGVQIEHRSARHLVCEEGRLFQVQPNDRVYQGFSIAFDASVEELWLAWFAGATLVVGTAEMVRAGAELPRLLTAAGVTVLSCVPTLLSMMEGEMPSVHLLILGGEACPQDLVKRWWRPGRRMVNTYGPTEATVIATFAECHPDRPVTIGRPLTGYSARILNADHQAVQPGVAGELCLGGVGLARGYVRRPELTNEKFIQFSADGGPPERLYRTGDLARLNPDGDIEFLGRIDTQVKIRGFRVELAEIESVLLEYFGIKAAAVALREDVPGLQQLVAYVVTHGAGSLDGDLVHAHLRKRLPAYMVPALLENIPSLPMLPSGKVDRKSLPTPSGANAPQREVVKARTEAEQQLASVWAPLFAPLPVSVKDDFFLDLGGHSLLAARMVSELRKTALFERLSMLDVYHFSTIESLAAEMMSRNGAGKGIVKAYPGDSAMPTATPASRRGEVQIDASESERVRFWRHFSCGTAQLVALVFILSFFALQWLAPYLTYTILVEEEYSHLEAILYALASLIVFYPLMVTVPVLAKWLVIGRYRAGSYPLWGSYYFRWWLVTTIEGTVPIGYLRGTPLMNLYLRAMGARIGRNVHLDTDSFTIYDMLTIGEDSSINVEASLPGYTVEDGCLKIGRITIGQRCFVGVRAAVGLDAVISDDAALEDLSLLPAGGRIPAGETWRGSPAALTTNPSISATRDQKEASEHKSRSASLARRFAFGLLHAIGLLIFPVLVTAPLFPGIVLMNYLNDMDPYYWYLFLAPLVGGSFVVLLALEIAALKWLILGKVLPGKYRLHTFSYLRRWFFGQTMELSLDVLGPLYASVYLKPWYSALGAKMGRAAEVSTASFVSPDLLSIGDESFIADSVSLGAPRVRNGCMELDRNHVGNRSFIGNSAMLPPGTVIGDSVLIGCLSAPPRDPVDAIREDSTWLGSPAIFLPQRQRSGGFDEGATFKPSRSLYIQRAAIELLRVILPSTGFIILLSLLFSTLLLLNDEFTLGQTLLFFPLLYPACGLAAAAVTIIVKWLTVGRYQAGEKPLWNHFVWRNELVNALHLHLAEPFLINVLTGTPFVCWYFRLLGARIGRRVYMETTDFSEFDLATIGDEAALNADCTIQTHLFEDRVMKMSTVDIGAQCVVGAGSLVLYDTRMEPGSALGELSLLMKGEVLPAGTKWQGSPARATRN
jgi:non-ribosomal peptide synthetase-like protein